MKITRAATGLTTIQNAAAAPILIRASKTFTGAANLGAVGVNELFTTTGAVLLEGFWVRCTDDLVDAVDGALFKIGVTGTDDLFNSLLGAFDLDTANAGDWIDSVFEAFRAGWGNNQAADTAGAQYTAVEPGISGNIIFTITTQAITGGTLEFYVLYRPLSSDGALTLGAGMVAI